MNGYDLIFRAVMGAGPDVVERVNVELDRIDPKRKFRSMPVEVVGEVVVIGKMPDGKHGNLTLVGTPEFKDGKMVALHLDVLDYAFQLQTREGRPSIFTGRARVIAEREKYPNWPNPEPGDIDNTLSP